MRRPWAGQLARCGAMRPEVGQALLTEFGTLLCWDPDARTLVNRPPTDLDGAHPVYWRRADQDELVADVDGRLEQVDPHAGGPMRAVPEPIHVVAGVGRGAVAFQLAGGRYLSARIEGPVWSDIPALNTWESFLPLSLPAVADLADLATGHWIVRAQDSPAPPGPMTVVGRDWLNLAGRSYPLADNLPVREPIRSASGVLSTGLLIRDGWKVDEIVRFRPLVAFVLLGHGARAEQLRFAAHSLARFGRYDGDVLVMTDLPADFVRDLFPTALRPNLTVRQVAGADRMDRISGRYLVVELPECADHQPVVYADTDVVFDAPLPPILRRLVLQSMITAQTERHAFVADRESVGARLFAQDPAAVAGLVGFNAGIMGFPNLHAHGRTIRTIRRTLAAYAARNGREHTWIDQPFANYVARKLDIIDPTLFTAAVRTAPGLHKLPDAAGAVGFVHFWNFAGDPEGRAAGMRAYCDSLSARLALAGAAVPASSG